MKVGIISDTHRLLRPEALDRLENCDHIIHAGDIGAPDIIPRLCEIAPTTAIRGNIDTAQWATGYPATTRVELAGHGIYILHDLKDLDIDPRENGIDIVISGHSHKPKIETVDGVLYLNPGSAGPRRFKLPVTVAELRLHHGEISPSICDLLGAAKADGRCGPAAKDL